MSIIVDVPQPFHDAPPRCLGDETEAPGFGVPRLPNDVCRETLWTVVRDRESGEVLRIWDAPKPAVV